MRYSDDIIEEVRMKNDIVDVISQYVRLTRRGILSYSQFRFFVYFTFLFKLGKSKDIVKYICLSFISF